MQHEGVGGGKGNLCNMKVCGGGKGHLCDMKGLEG